jgi:zinc protease
MGNNIKRAAPPVEGSLQHFEIPIPAEKVMSRGNIISHYQRDNIPLINMMMSFPYGALLEHENEKGLLNLLCSVLDEGTKSRTSLEFSDAIEFLGSSLSIQADYEQIIISLQSLSEKFEETLQLLHEMLQQPRFELKDFEREKNNILVRLRQAKDMPEAIADRAYRNIVYHNTGNYGAPVHGTMKGLTGIDLPQVREWYIGNMQKSTPDVFSAGDIAFEELKNSLEKIQLLHGEVTKSERKSYVTDLPERQIYIVDKPESVQTEIVVGHLTNNRTDNDYFAKVLLNMIFGGQFSSRLNLNLREKNGLTYGVHSSFNYHVYAGDFRIGTSVSSGDTGKAIREILLESERIGNDITRDEIDFARTSLVNRFTLNFETYGQLVSNSYSRHLFGLPGNYYHTYVDNVLAVTADDIHGAAQKRISTAKYQIVLVGSTLDIEKSLSESGIDIPVQKIQNESLW